MVTIRGTLGRAQANGRRESPGLPELSFLRMRAAARACVRTYLSCGLFSMARRIRGELSLVCVFFFVCSLTVSFQRRKKWLRVPPVFFSGGRCFDSLSVSNHVSVNCSIRPALERVRTCVVRAFSVCSSALSRPHLRRFLSFLFLFLRSLELFERSWAGTFVCVLACPCASVDICRFFLRSCQKNGILHT